MLGKIINNEESIEMKELLYGLNFMINSDKIKSSDIHKAIEKVKKQNKRASGRSSRILNSIIEEFFQNPIGTHIAIYDHSTNKNDVRIMVNNVERRLKNEYPQIKYRIGYELNSTPYIIKIE